MGPANQIKVSALDIAIIIYHVYVGSKLEDVGFEDCDRTLHQLMKELAPKRYPVNIRTLESALWSANMMDEQSQFWSPTGESFNDFHKRILSAFDQKLEFNEIYNRIINKEEIEGGSR